MAARLELALPRIVELLRVSGQGQADRDTPADQRNALDKLRESYPGVLVERIDCGAVKAVSGAKDINHRPDLLRLKELAQAKAFDELRVRHADRITRHADIRERAAIFGMLADAGAILRDASGHVIDPTTELGELDWYLQTFFAAKERKRIAERTLAARHRLSAQGVIMTTVPYGRTYDRERGTWGLNEDEAKVYRSIFQDILSGKSLRSIAQALNDKGIPSPRGSQWRPGAMRALVIHPSAIGKVTSYGHAIECPAIVDVETQDAVKAVLTQGRSRSGPGHHHEALLRKVARCGECGSIMHVALGGQNRIVYYVCSQHRKPGHDAACGLYHPILQVDPAVKDALRPLLANPDALLRNIQKPTKGNKNAGADLDSITADLDDLAKREEKLVRLASKNMMSESVYEKQAREIARLREAATARLSVAQAQVEAAQRAAASAKDIEAALKNARTLITKDDFDGWRKVIGLLLAGPDRSCRIMPDGEVRFDGLLPVGDTSVFSDWLLSTQKA